jgi:hypothetical protein
VQGERAPNDAYERVFLELNNPKLHYTDQLRRDETLEENGQEKEGCVAFNMYLLSVRQYQCYW